MKSALITGTHAPARLFTPTSLLYRNYGGTIAVRIKLMRHKPGIGVIDTHTQRHTHAQQREREGGGGTPYGGGYSMG